MTAFDDSQFKIRIMGDAKRTEESKAKATSANLFYAQSSKTGSRYQCMSRSQ